MRELGIEKVVLTFENCDQLEIPGWHIGDFIVDDIKTTISRIACNAIEKVISANSIFIEISSAFNKEFNSLFGESKMTNFERIEKFSDITSIEIYYERAFITDENTVERFFVDYDEEGDFLGAKNLNQKNYYDKLGDLILCIGKDEKLKERAKSFITRDDEEIKFSHDMYSMDIPFEPKHYFVQELTGENDFPEINRQVWLYDKDERSMCRAKWDGKEWQTVKEDLDYNSIEKLDNNSIVSWQYVRSDGEETENIYDLSF